LFRRGIDHVRALWGRFWFLPLLPALYAALLATFGELRPEHVAFGLLCLALGFASARSKRFFVDISPYVGVAIAYDLVRYARPFFVTEERVLGCGLRNAELTFFRAGPGTTFQDYFAAHHTPFFDVLFAIPYTIFVYVVIVYAAYLYFKDRTRMRVYLMAFAIGNAISFTCWLLIPAAPPWYLRAHGCVIDAGALPSMHCAYPVIGLLTSWRASTAWARPIHLAYAAIMAVAAVYLDHHWVIDVLAGWTVAVVAVRLSTSLVGNLSRAAARLPAAARGPVM
jgi:membrane-associated phospholipid phosphatase